MSLLTTNVTSTYVDPSLTPIAGVPVVATLQGPISSLSGTSVNREEVTRTGSNGSWTLALLPNSLLSEDSFYLIRVGTKETYEVIVPITDGSTPVGMSTILRAASVAEIKCAFIGDMTLVGDIFVEGNLQVTGEFSATTQFEYAELDPGEIPTFPGSLDIVGDLTVDGSVSVKGTITVGV